MNPAKRLALFWWRNFAYDPLTKPKQYNGHIVAIGGGTGLANLLRGIRPYVDHVSAIVTMTDNGASSGKLREEFDVMPPGDIRKCLVALSNSEDILTQLFEYRFPGEISGGVAGHSLGNLFLTALSEIGGNFEKGIELASLLLDTKGVVYPSVLEPIDIIGHFDNGSIVCGECELVKEGHRQKISRVKLSREIPANKKAIEAVENANVILIGPGSLYTSIIPNFLSANIVEAIVNSKAKKIYICNASTERGETEGYTIEDHIDAIIDHSSPKIMDICLVPDKPLLEESEGELGNIHNLSCEITAYKGIKIIKGDIIDIEKPLYHNPDKLGKYLINLL